MKNVLKRSIELLNLLSDNSSISSENIKDNIPDWKVQTTEWNVEDDKSWRTEEF